MAPAKIQWTLGCAPDRVGVSYAGYFLIGALLSLVVNVMVSTGTMWVSSWVSVLLLFLTGIRFNRELRQQVRRGVEEAGTEARRCIFAPRAIHTETQHIRSTWPYTSIRRLLRRGPWLIIEVDINTVVVRNEPGLEEWLRERTPAAPNRPSIGHILFATVMLFALVAVGVIAVFSPDFG